MPSRADYPSWFVPGYRPYLNRTEPTTTLVRYETLYSYDESSEESIDLRELRENYPEATHIHIEAEYGGDHRFSAKIQRRVEESNPHYQDQLNSYKIQKAIHEERLAEYESLNNRWLAESKAENEAAERAHYIKLKAKYEN